MPLPALRALAGLTAALLAAPLAAEPRPAPRPLVASEVCGDPTLVGTPVAPIREAGGCGIGAPIRLAEAAGIALEPAPTLACEAARALSAWLVRGPRPAFAAKGARIDALTVVDAYSCRNRNRAEAGELSEHARGRAIDIAGFRLDDGTTVSIGEGWESDAWGPVLRRIHAAGCGTFGTVLGPDANPLHADHLASRRGGAPIRGLLPIMPGRGPGDDALLLRWKRAGVGARHAVGSACGNSETGP
jgi:hypothetical protein